MAMAKLSIDLDVMMARFEADMGKANGHLERMANGATTAGQRMREIFVGNFGAQIATDALQRIVALFPAVIDGVLAIKDLSEATGATVENISALDDIARRTGGSLQDVEGVLIKFNAALKDADPGSKMAKVFEAIGLNANELRELDPAEALQRAAVAIEQFADNGDRARLVQELFGKGVKNASTFLRDLAEAGRLNATVTSEQAEAVDQFDKNLANLRTNVSNAARSLVSELIPALNQVFERLNNGSLRKSFELLGAEISANLKTDDLNRAMAQLESVQATIERQGATALLEKRRDALRAEVAALLRDSVAAADAVRKFIPSVPGDDTENQRRFRKPNVPDIGRIQDPAKVKAAAAAFEDYSASLTRGLADMIGKTDIARFAEINAQLDRLQQLADAGLDPAIVEQVRALLVPPAGDKMGPPLSDELARINDLLKQTDSARLASLRQDMAMLITEMERTDESTERWSRLREALASVQGQINELNLGTKEFTDETAQQLEDLRNTVQGALGDTISRAMRGEIDSIGEMWANLLVEMTSRAIATDIMDALFGKSGKGGGSSFGWIDTIFSFFGMTKSANGNAFDQSGLIAFANGGIVDRATPFSFGGGRAGVMGEAGPEAILPLKRGGDGKLGVVSRGGGVVINQTINVQAGASRNEVMQAAAAAKNAAVSEIIDLQRRGRIQ